MERTPKICGMCRKMVDQAAILCPHCRSDTNYQYFIEIAAEQIIRERRPVRKIVAIIISIMLIGLVGLFGIALAGFWVGIGFALIAGCLLAAVSEKLGAMDYDKAQIICSGCGHANDYRWPAGTFEAGKQAFFMCLTCKQTTRLTVGNLTRDLTTSSSGILNK